MISAIVLNYRSADQTLQAVRSISETLCGENAEIIVVDNASRDGSAHTIRTAYPQARVIELSANLGFAAGMNAGIREACGDYLLLLNSDVEALPGALDAMLSYARAHADVGLTAPLLIDDRGNAARSLLVQPTVWRVLLPMLGKLRYNRWRGRIAAEPMDVEATEGAAILVSRTAIDKAGLLDEDFFFYHEIVEWCLRIRDAGFRVVLVPSARMKHLCGGSTGGIWLPARIELKRSEYQLLEKRFGGAVKLLAVARDTLSEAVKCAFYRLPGLSRTRLAAHAAVLRWILMGMPGRREERYRSRFGVWD